MNDSPDEEVGSVAEEAAKLLGALQEWARESGGEYAGAAAGLASGAADMFGSVNEHIATGGKNCRYCPLCQVIAAVRATSPEVRQHLTSAAGSLLQAASSAMAADGSRRGGRSADEPLERIDLTGEAWDDES